MTDVYPWGPQKDARLNDGCGHARASQDRRPSDWVFCTVVPRTDVKGRNFGKEHPEYKSILEQHRLTNEYRTRPLTEVLEG